MPNKQKYHVPEKSNIMSVIFTGDVRILFEDGSRVYFEHAFTQPEDDYIVVYTEHCGYHSFPKESVERIQELKNRN